MSDLIGRALKDLGVPSARLSRRIEDAWRRVADPAWGERTRPVRLTGGVLEVEVASSVLRQELTQFHRMRLLEVLRTAVPDLSLVGVRFVVASAATDEGHGGTRRTGP